ncbi:hypothetical protein RB213_002104, partial [Colletotrichum asianum]
MSQTMHRVFFQEDNSCPVCQDIEDSMLVLQCGHTLCQTCTAAIVVDNNHCPNCRENL